MPPSDPRYRDSSHLLELSYEKCFSVNLAEKEYRDAVDTLPTKEHRDRIISAAFNVYSSHLYNWLLPSPPPTVASPLVAPATGFGVELPATGFGVELPAEPLTLPEQPVHRQPSGFPTNASFSGIFRTAPSQGEPASSVHLPCSSFLAAMPPLQLLDPSPTVGRPITNFVTPQYSLAYGRFKVRTMTPTNQIHFLYLIVKDVLCLGRSSSDHVPKPSPVSMPSVER
jgi:hypothetical protein